VDDDVLNENFFFSVAGAAVSVVGADKSAACVDEASPACVDLLAADAEKENLPAEDPEGAAAVPVPVDEENLSPAAAVVSLLAGPVDVTAREVGGGTLVGIASAKHDIYPLISHKCYT
jgi:methenyltetrahydromethanopterin cyclohydrolase